MAQREIPDTTTLIAGALDWWRDAGVDCAFLDEPVRWIAPAEEPVRAEKTPANSPVSISAREPAPAAPAPSLAANLPDTLESFTRWWMEEPSLAEGSLATRVPPRGSEGAEMMVIVPEPEPADGDTLLAGAQGRLLDAMLRAFGLSAEQVYLASTLPRHLPAADWDELAARGIGTVLARHVALAAPKRLAVFGANILPLIGNGPPQGPADLRIFNHEDVKLPMLASRSLAALLEQPRWKARVWQAWLEWDA